MSEFYLAIAISLLWKLPVTMLCFAVAEWAVHYIAMHRRLPLLGFIYRAHHIEHHANGLNTDWHIDLTFRDYLITTPFLAVSCYRIYLGHAGGWSGAISIITMAVCHCYLWNSLHRNIHEIKGKQNWTRRLWFYPAFAKHHLDHHKRPFTNYGVVFLFTDRLFGTKYQESEAGE